MAGERKFSSFDFLLKRAPQKYFCEMVAKMVYNPTENTPVKMSEMRAMAKVL